MSIQLPHEETTDAHEAVFASFKVPDAHSYGLFKVLDELCKSVSDKVTQGNPFMRKLVTSGYNPMDILKYPMCDKCETIALPNGYVTRNGKRHRRCTCTANGCGKDTIDPITLRDWLLMELRTKAPENIKEVLDYCFDSLAMRIVNIAQRNVQEALGEHQAMTDEMMGIHMPGGKTHNFIPEKPKITHINVANVNDIDPETELKRILEEEENV